MCCKGSSKSVVGICTIGEGVRGVASSANCPVATSLYIPPSAVASPAHRTAPCTDAHTF